MLSETNCKAKLKSTESEFSINSKIRQLVIRTAVLKNITERKNSTTHKQREETYLTVPTDKDALQYR